MPDFRAFCTPPAAETAELALSPEESHHLVAVNRARAGDPVTAFDGRGTEWLATLEVADKRAARLRVQSVRTARPLPHRITLGQALPKGGTMDAIVRKATELGAARVVPLESERSQVHLDGDRSGRKVEKWRTAALEAAKQCGNPWLPEIGEIQTVAALLDSRPDFDLRLIASLQAGSASLKSVLAAFRAARGRPPFTVLWLIGPEGDFTPGETRLALARGFEPVTLGPLVLRCDTAAVYALSVLNHELQ
jgi:16S rRNA (uracil1498-N3)-methyltransferase